MQAFLQHVGHQNLHHIEDTITSLRTIEELLGHIPPSALVHHHSEFDG